MQIPFSSLQGAGVWTVITGFLLMDWLMRPFFNSGISLTITQPGARLSSILTGVLHVDVFWTGVALTGTVVGAMVLLAIVGPAAFAETRVRNAVEMKRLYY